MKISIVKILVCTVALAVFSLGFVAAFPDQSRWLYGVAGLVFGVFLQFAVSAIFRRNGRNAGESLESAGS